MSDVQFADILFILLTCIVIFIILTLVNRGKKVVTKQQPPVNPEDSSESNRTAVDED